MAKSPRTRSRASGAPALDRLAERLGIEGEYRDAAGKRVIAPTAVKRALIRVMGFTIPNDAAAEARLRVLEEQDWARLLPPVVVVRDDRQPVAVPLTLPAGTGAVVWTVATEDGGSRSGRVDAADLDPLGHHQNQGHDRECRRLIIEERLPWGYHRLAVRIEATGASADMSLIVAPPRCWLPPGLGHHRLWGIAAQLYLLRSAGNWGIGDFTDLRALTALAADLGAAVVGLNPLHTLPLDRPEHASPYSPLSRLFLNVLYIDITALPEFAACPEARRLVNSQRFQKSLAAARDAALVDYAGVARLKRPVLERLHDHFRLQADPARAEAYAAFRREQGPALERLAVFQGLREAMVNSDPSWADWRLWPEAFQDPSSPAVAGFAEDFGDVVDFLIWLQWIADTQLAEASRAAAERGLAIGLYRDLAVGADRTGAETWINRHLVVSGAAVGAPPDLFNPAGQNWGLPPFDPRVLREEGYAGFIDLVRANMRHAGALRIDHAMALQHVYWIPEGLPPDQGAYVSYPLDDLVGILALESHRRRCMVIGEDLGTVPSGFRERMADADILSYRVLFFEHDANGAFIRPDDYPALALATIGNHDLATLRGWWEARDIDLKEKHGLYPDPAEAGRPDPAKAGRPDPAEAGRQRALRADQRRRLIDALVAEGLWSEGLGSNGDPEALTMTGPLREAVHAFLARSAAAVAMVQLDDLTDEGDQVNLPATLDAYPNWRRKVSLPLEPLSRDPQIRALARILRTARPPSTGP